ncbi:uncharacterized protein LOC119106972 [Pollicipes pollicipes]|uniref:uncharacterized protein LOC119106972 n=1 Tax=Pollicipes pollicipes TaxID=41117 RepID=UPI0018852BF0|nr:uncharacterized protein LOC119106972 [Pollicipes pollicipes]
MTRFARYSTKGIQKPPCEATPWSELAPPTAATEPLARANDPGNKASMKKNKGKQNQKAKHHVANKPSALKPGKKFGGPKHENKKSGKQTGMPESELDDSGVCAPTVLTTGLAGTAQPMKDVDTSEASSGAMSLKNKVAGTAEKSKKSKKSKKVVQKVSAEANGDLGETASGQLEKHVSAKVTKKGLKRKDGAAISNNVKRQCKSKRDEDCGSPEIIGAPHISQRPGVDSEDPAEGVTNSDPATAKPNGFGRQVQKKKKRKKPRTKTPVGAAPSGPPILAENRLMTQFDGYWVRRRAVPRLERVRAELAAAITDPQKLKREMKKRKRAEHRKLLSLLAARGGGAPTTASARLEDADDGEEADSADDDAPQSSEGCVKERRSAGEQAATAPPSAPDDRQAPRRDGGGPQREERMVKFDGVWMTGDAVGRLKELRRQLKLQRVSDVVLKQTMKTARRREEMKRKRDAKKVCLGCRQPGHQVSECPQRTGGGQTPVTGLCFRCGSTEHRLSECRAKQGDGGLPFAVCFVCGQTGHLSRECSLNPNGVYPRGGACKVCHQRSHLADDCPERREEEAAAGAPRLATLASGAALEDDYEHDFRTVPATEAGRPAAFVARKPRQVKF